jgi:hypothetical protein
MMKYSRPMPIHRSNENGHKPSGLRRLFLEEEMRGLMGEDWLGDIHQIVTGNNPMRRGLGVPTIIEASPHITVFYLLSLIT